MCVHFPAEWQPVPAPDPAAPPATAAPPPSAQLPGGQHTGTSFKDHFLHTLCARTWPTAARVRLADVSTHGHFSCFLPLAVAFLPCIDRGLTFARWGLIIVWKMCRDLPLGPEQHSLVAAKIVECLDGMQLEELPPLVYQLLLFATKGHRSEILRGLVAHFDALDRDSADGRDNAMETTEDGDSCGPAATQSSSRDVSLLRTIEGTIILHFSFAVKQDQELGASFIKMLKKAERHSPFCVALALSFAKMHRFSNAVFAW